MIKYIEISHEDYLNISDDNIDGDSLGVRDWSNLEPTEYEIFMWASIRKPVFFLCETGKVLVPYQDTLSGDLKSIQTKILLSESEMQIKWRLETEWKKLEHQKYMNLEAKKEEPKKGK